MSDRVVRPFTTADPVEPGWERAAWYRAFNAANYQIYIREGIQASKRARTTGRTREAAKISRAEYCTDSIESLQTGISHPNIHSSQPSTTTMAVTPTFTYPLTKLQAEQVVTINEEDNANIDRELASIRARCIEQCQSNTNKCAEHAKEIRRLLRTFYTSPRNGSWASYRSVDYITEMKKMFDSKVEIQRIHAYASKEKRMHTKDTLCTIRFNDDPAVKQYKKEAAAMFDSKASEEKIRDFIHQKEIEVAEQRTSRQRMYDRRLASCENEDQKREIFQQDACTPMGNDTIAMSKLRVKWKPLFESGMPYSEIHAIMRKDIDYHHQMERELNEKLAELQLAKTAHDKKARTKLAKEAAAKKQMLADYTFYCTSKNCQNLAVPISQEEGLLECGICNQLVHDGVLKEHAYFCNEECMEENGRDHILEQHNCAAGAACTIGRSIQETYCGVCIDCWKHFKVISYFCTNECWHRNWKDHVSQRHTELRAELVEKLMASEEAFEMWKDQVGVTEEDYDRALADAHTSAH